MIINSSWELVKSMDHQDSKLCMLLFPIYKDLGTRLKGLLCKFADDIKLVYPVNKNAEQCTKIQNHLN